ncbi:DUF4783 domain-containing protein [Marivirga salinae]|uniref:DUF4783 domain-containing protein n=1 Tax=Marivirga salinarum TaxID=3059078 RepID=A0AA49GCQ2_9BACT|nr:DUF4783 domain-containing protein [Marivirga sp. BDSF4-3]WKK78382.2 DUF4783 domain-containing protein [Marivirga sp. BDSF4-3]
MKGIGIKFFYLLLFSSFSNGDLYGQNESLFADVRSALKAGSSKELSQYFHDNIGLNIKDESGNYSKVHAEIYLKEFFKKHEPISFEYAIQQSTKEDLKYAIGNYVHSQGTYSCSHKS